MIVLKIFIYLLSLLLASPIGAKLSATISDQKGSIKLLAKCSFEFGLCNWLPDENYGHFDIVDLSKIRIPRTDHTYGSRKGRILQYIQTNESRPVQEQGRALIRSPWVVPTNTVICLQYSYHFGGTINGQIRILIEDGVKTHVIDDTVKPNLDNTVANDDWQFGMATFIFEPFNRARGRLVIEASPGKQYTSVGAWISFDDVFLFTNGCPRHAPLSNCSLGKTVPCVFDQYCYRLEERCNGHLDCSDGSDEFYCNCGIGNLATRMLFLSLLSVPHLLGQ